MKTILLAAATFITSTVTISSFAQETINPGDNLPFPEIEMRNANGKATTLKASMEENGLLVMFSCNTCPFVVRNEPITKKVMEYAHEHHVGMVILNSNEAQRDNSDSYEAMEHFAKGQHYAVPYLIDANSKLADRFGANHTPEVYLFNKQGKLVYKGAMNDNPGDPDSYKHMYVEDAINSMIAGKDVDPKTTKSVGCSIKRKA